MSRYIELKTGNNDDGPAWIGRVKLSKSGQTVYFNRRALKKGARGAAGNFFDLKTGEVFWVAGIKRDCHDRHWADSGKVLIEASAVDDYLSLVGEPALDRSRFSSPTRSGRQLRRISLRLRTSGCESRPPPAAETDGRGLQQRESNCRLLAPLQLSGKAFGDTSPVEGKVP
jgi:hypothetical protein